MNFKMYEFILFLNFKLTVSGPFGVDVVPLVEILDLKEDTN